VWNVQQILTFYVVISYNIFFNHTGTLTSLFSVDQLASPELKQKLVAFYQGNMI